MGLVCFTRVNDSWRTTRHCGLLYEIHWNTRHLGYYFPTLGFDQLYYGIFPFGIFGWGIMRFIILCYFSLICCLSLSTGWVVILYYFTLQLISVQYMFYSCLLFILYFLFHVFLTACFGFFLSRLVSPSAHYTLRQALFRHHSSW